MSYYSQVLPLVFQFCLCHHFVVRIYAAGTVLEMWRECKNLEFDSQQYSTLSSLEQYIPFIENYRLIIKLDCISMVHCIYSFINSMVSIHPLSSDVAKSKKIESNIFFKLFHPLEDLNLQVSNILYCSELMRLN